MTAAERRNRILELMKSAQEPLAGGALGRETGVSRQVVVQDIALLRTEGHPIVATARGYYLDVSSDPVRLFKVRHTSEETEEELTAIVDMGGCVMDVMVNHRIYGKMTAPLNIKNRRDVQNFMRDIRSGKSVPLLNVTSGWHYHNISAEQEEILDEIEAMLKSRGFLSRPKTDSE